jgi:molybdate/tungstate transport system substrate-binding protein
VALALVLLAVLAAAGCGASPKKATLAGPVNVLYAGSLVNLMEHRIGPAFDKATGAAFQGFPGGSDALANEIRGKVRRADVFISASPSADTALEGARNGDWVSWYASFGKSPLVIGYNPDSRFATDFRTLPWYEVLTSRGIRAGRTDPELDPKGRLTVTALDEAQSTYHLPGFAAAVESEAPVYPEETLVGRLQSGQLDAGFFYTLEAAQLGIPTVSLAPVDAAATFTITVLNHAPHPAAAAAFVSYLLGAGGRATLAANGMTLTGPTLSGSAGAVPPSLAGVVGG